VAQLPTAHKFIGAKYVPNTYIYLFIFVINPPAQNMYNMYISELQVPSQEKSVQLTNIISR